MTRQLPWQQRWLAILGRLRGVEDDAGMEALLRELTLASQATVIAFVNAHAMNLLAGNQAFFEALSEADLLLRDGSGMALLCRWRGMKTGLNMNGTDFIPRLLHAFRGRRVALWGTQQPALGAAVRHCAEAFSVDVVSSHHGFDTVERYLALAADTRPDLIVLGMGMPKQEQLAASLRALNRPAVVVCGGAILDFLGGKVTRAPHWMRRLGCEWLYRLFLEPRRLFARYVLGNPAFVLRLIALGGNNTP